MPVDLIKSSKENFIFYFLPFLSLTLYFAAPNQEGDKLKEKKY